MFRRNRGFTVPYLWYIEATVRIPPIIGYNECILILVLKSCSPYNSRVPIQLGTTVLERAMAVLVMKKNGKLCFCIDLRKLNSLMVKDTCSIPLVQVTLDCLQGAVWFTLLDLKSRYWQVELEEANTALTAFTVYPLRFYECR